MMKEDELERARVLGHQFKPDHERMRFKETAEILMAARGFDLNDFDHKVGYGWNALARALNISIGALKMRRAQSEKFGRYCGPMEDLYVLANLLKVRPWIWFMTPDEQEKAELAVGVEVDEVWL